MNDTSAEAQALLAAALKLSPLDRLELAQALVSSLKSDLEATEKKPKRDVYGIWAGTSVSADEIDEARREMWGNFPREDI